jgi:hypothetical protein
MLRLPVGLIAVAAIFLWPGIVGPGFDAAVFTLIAFRIRAGDMPYRDVWDHKPPGIFLADASAQSLLPWLDPWTPVWLLSVLCAAALGLVVAFALRANGHPKLAPWCGFATTVTVAAVPISYGGGQTELVAAVPAAAAVVALWRRYSPAVTFGSGALIGLALSTSWHLAPAAAVALALVLQGTDRWRRVVLLALGTSAVGAAVAFWLIAGGAWSDALDALLTYNAAYRAANLLDPVIKLSPSAAAAFLAIAALLGLIAMTRRRPRALFVAAAAWIGLSVAMFAFEGRLGAHYLASIVVPLGLLAGPGLALVAPRKSSGVIAVGRVSAQLLLISAAAISGFFIVYWTQTLGEIYATRASSLRDAAGWLKTVDCSETLLVWGHAPEIYYMSGLRPASRYVYFLPLMTDGYVTADRVADVEKDLDSLRPAAIIDASSWGGAVVTYPLLGPGLTTVDEERYVDRLEPLRDRIRSQYVFARDFAGWPAYTLEARDPLPCGRSRAVRAGRSDR